MIQGTLRHILFQGHFESHPRVLEKETRQRKREEETEGKKEMIRMLYPQ